MTSRRARRPAFDRLEARLCRARAAVIVIDHSQHQASTGRVVASAAETETATFATSLASDATGDADQAPASDPIPDAPATPPVRKVSSLRLRRVVDPEAGADEAPPTPRATGRAASSAGELILTAGLSDASHLHDVALSVLIDRGPSASTPGPAPRGGRHGGPGDGGASAGGHEAPAGNHVPQAGGPPRLLASTMSHRRARDRSTREVRILDVVEAAHDAPQALEPSLEPALEPELEPSLDPGMTAPATPTPHAEPEAPLPVPVAVRAGGAIEPGLLRVEYNAGEPPADPGWLAWLAAQIRALVAWIAA